MPLGQDLLLALGATLGKILRFLCSSDCYKSNPLSPASIYNKSALTVSRDGPEQKVPKPKKSFDLVLDVVAEGKEQAEKLGPKLRLGDQDLNAALIFATPCPSTSRAFNQQLHFSKIP